ncbi:exodeoxyribonuclease VII large subunit [Mesoterricola sediminis]|uniref:Exodeoxyribonuclease 7 large subunit n=1 Tax=Mesoterricola sediminis TaxID=2927980 RepID=A0AA48H5J4_9BACT|nr:exodeoxyribonuclease VII large subunit [Mesoterricola sediminis]BDU77791.1 exodeoxyribonuclease 7 large subunit [Mesoterricola sediminis]
MDAPISVKRFLEQVKARVEPAFSAVCLLGEVSNVRDSGRHWYFTLKEEGAALSCAVWASQQRFLAHAPRNGDRVVVKGSLNLYVPGGSLTLAVTHCEKAGQGDLQERLRRLEADLRAQGVFDRPRRPLPGFPRRLGVVAAPGGAALRDVLQVTLRRAPGVDILVAPAAAQGDRAAAENAWALAEIQDPHWGCDAILLIRGGGSAEDLGAFNDPDLVRAVAACRLPVVTGVGHEIDTTLVDLAADRRAATPSQAAEWATPDLKALAAQLERRVAALQDRMAWRLRGLESQVNLLTDSHGLRVVPERIARAGERLAALQHRLARTTPGPALALERLVQRLHLAHPAQRLQAHGARLALLRQRLQQAGQGLGAGVAASRIQAARTRLAPAAEAQVRRAAHRLDLLEARLRALDPRGPLDRGFTLVRDAEGRVLTRPGQAAKGSRVELVWKDGSRRADLVD